MTGQTISHYKILEKLGAGGMGVVYKAQDTKLNRPVALKFLPQDLTRDQETIDRFINEAQAASALDHTNICAIYEIGETEEGRMFIVMAYYAGETLQKKVASGQLSVDSVIDIVTQTARGLERAHEAGITHRDIKPSNLIITPRGEVKIIDFGLAKLAGQTRLTKTGSTLGTVAYMSPEQVQAQPVDHRTDIWSLGVVLYEMLTGKLPFRGEYEAAMIYTIVNEKPEALAKHRTDVLEGLQQVLDKALVKDVEARYQHIDELLADLKGERKTGSTSTKPISRVKSGKIKRAVMAYVSVALFVVFATVIGTYVFNRLPTKQIPATHKQVTFIGDASLPAVSPDGQFIAYVKGIAGVEQKVFVQDLAGGQPLEIFQEPYCFDLRWSPDGTELVFAATFAADSTRNTYILPRLGGKPQKLDVMFFLSWSPDGSQIAGGFNDSTFVRIINKQTGEKRELTLKAPMTWLWDVDWSPAGHLLLFLVEHQQVYTIWTTTMDGKPVQKVVADSTKLYAAGWSPKGDAIYYFRFNGQTRDLMKIAVDPASGKPKGRAAVLQGGLQAGDEYVTHFTLSSDGRRLLYPRHQQHSNLWLITLEGAGENTTVKTKQLTTGTSLIKHPSVSPDGKQVAFSLATFSGSANIYTIPVDGGDMQQITFLNAFSYNPSWSPDGKQIAFGSTQGAGNKVWLVNAKGGSPRQLSQSRLNYEFQLSWSPGANILYVQPDNRNLHILDPKTGEERPLLKDESLGYTNQPHNSPDGKKIAVRWDRWEAGINWQDFVGVWVFSSDGVSQRLLYRSVFAFPVAWSTDGNWIYAADLIDNQVKIVMINATNGEAKLLATLPFAPHKLKMLERFISMTPASRTFVCRVYEEFSDVWLMENFDPEVK